MIYFIEIHERKIHEFKKIIILNHKIKKIKKILPNKKN